MNLEQFDECIQYATLSNSIGMGKGTDIQKVFLGFSFTYLKKKLTQDQLEYYFQNYEQLQRIKNKNNLSDSTFVKYLYFFFKHTPDLSQIVLNKRVIITPEIIIHKIKTTAQYDFGGFSLKVGNISLQAFKERKGVYRIGKYNCKDDTSINGYDILFTVEVPNLKLKKVHY